MQDIGPTPPNVFKVKRFSKNVDDIKTCKFSGMAENKDQNVIDQHENTYNLYNKYRRNSVADQISKLEIFGNKSSASPKKFDLPPIHEPAYEEYSSCKAGK